MAAKPPATSGLDPRRTPLWPSARDLPLLQGALGEGAAAVAGWRRWHAGADYANLDPAWQRLLPLLGANLRRLGVADPVLEHYRAVGRFFWFRNTLLFRQVAALCATLRRRGVPVLLLKGMPLALAYYPHKGLRPMGDADLLVPRAQAPQALAALAEAGWTCANPSLGALTRPEQLLCVRHGLNLRHPAGGEIDLHWELLRNCFAGSDSLWPAACPLPLEGATLQTLCPADHLLQALAQPAEWDVIRPIRWLADARMILARGQVDWGRLVAQARRFELAEVVRDGLEVLRELCGDVVPEEARGALRRARSPFWARLDYRVNARPPLPLVGKPLRRYLRYRRVRRHRPISFAGYLRDFWGLPRLPSVLRTGVRALWRELTGRPG
jgi:hypothetical protein